MVGVRGAWCILDVLVNALFLCSLAVKPSKMDILI